MAEPPADELDGDDSLSRTVYREIFDRILSGNLAPGAVVSEKQLAESLGVSRTPVHNAILQLVKDGLVSQEANRRPVIRSVSAADVEEIFDMRRLLEGEAARRAARRMDRETLAQLRTAGQALEQRIGRPGLLAHWADFDDQFHDAIALACGSSRLAADIRRYRIVHHALNRLRMTEALVPQALAEHLAILAGLEARDPQRAAAAMDVHLLEWKAFYLQRVVSEQGRTPAAGRGAEGTERRAVRAGLRRGKG